MLLANDLRLPLVAYTRSRNESPRYRPGMSVSAIDRFVGELSFGGGAVNQVNIHLFIESMPFEVSDRQEWVTTMGSMALTC
jgi:hypothetical protein